MGGATCTLSFSLFIGDYQLPVEEYAANNSLIHDPTSPNSIQCINCVFATDFLPTNNPTTIPTSHPTQLPIIDPYDKIYLERLGVPDKFFKTFNKKEDFINFFDNFFKIKNKNIKKIAYKKFRNKFFCNNSDKSFFLK